jgi:hypothetical protein
VQVAVVLASVTGNFLDIARADLVLELTTSPASYDMAVYTAGFALGLLLLLLVALLDRGSAFQGVQSALNPDVLGRRGHVEPASNRRRRS